jgi:hypothetical protein
MLFGNGTTYQTFRRLFVGSINTIVIMKKPLDSKFAIFGCVFCEEFE